MQTIKAIKKSQMVQGLSSRMGWVLRSADASINGLVLCFAGDDVRKALRDMNEYRTIRGVASVELV